MAAVVRLLLLPLLLLPLVPFVVAARKVVEAPAGRNVRLRCSVAVPQHRHRNRYVWDFNRDHDTNGSAGWAVIARSSRRLLVLRRVDARDSGVYRCSRDAVHLAEYRLRVFDDDDDHDQERRIARLVDLAPTEQTLRPNDRLVVRCAVHSAAVPVMLWFKRVDATDRRRHRHRYHVPYGNDTYVGIGPSVQHPLGERTHVSKLFIEKVAEHDSGVYKCVALYHDANLTSSDVRVSVLLPDDNDALLTGGSPVASLYALFLVPFVLALVPVVAWLCYFNLKRAVAGAQLR